jgi:hypothetical protein
VAAAEVLLAASLVLTVLSLFTGPAGDVPFNPTQLTTGSTATHAALHAHVRAA